MQLSPHEQERLLVHVAAGVARERRERGLLLNYPAAVAVLTSWVFEAARDGRSVAEIMSAGRDTDVYEWRQRRKGGCPVEVRSVSGG